MDQKLKAKILTQIKKAQGMLNKVHSMIEEEKYCINILQQSLAANGFIKSANRAILENHLNSCFTAGINTNSPTKQKQLINELLRVINKA